MREAVWNYWEEQLAPGFWNLGQERQAEVRTRCSSMQQVLFFHLGTVFNGLQEVCLLKDFMFIKCPSPNLIIPEVFRYADHRRRKYWSFLLSKLVNFLYESGRTNLDTEDSQYLACSGWNALYHIWLNYSSAVFVGNLLLQQKEQKGKERGGRAVIQVIGIWTNILFKKSI